jgi:peroxiredoxin
MRLIYTIILYSICCSLSAQEGYKIDFKVKGLKDTTAYLAFYYQEKIYIKDTAKVDNQGAFTFAKSKSLTPGVYLLVVNSTKLVDLIVSSDQHFSLETSAPDYIKNMVVKGDEDNRIFFENEIFYSTIDQEAKPFASVLQDSTASEDQKKEARAKLNAINDKVMAHRQTVIDKYPKALTVRMMLVNKPITIPDAPKKADGSTDPNFQLHYYRQHYFDNFDLADETMLRMPKVFYWEKVKDYLNKLYIQHPDTITAAINRLASVAKKNQETYKYLMWNCLVTYQRPEIMGMDEVFVNIVDKYIATGEMDYWLDKKTVANLKDEANHVRQAMIGRTAPNLLMQDENLQPRSLYDIKSKYTIILFFKPTCGTCREEAPKLVDFYKTNKQKLGLEIFAVSTDSSMKEMKNFIKDMKTPWITVNGPRSYIKTHFSNLYYAESTPTLYVIDEKKKVIARKIGVEQLPGFFENYEKMRQATKRM